jgi:predicted RNA-binding protein with PIN domain
MLYPTCQNDIISSLPYGIPVYLAIETYVKDIVKLIIDGYNLIRSITHTQATTHDLQHMLGRLRRYQRVTGHEIVFVLDGGDSVYRYHASYHGITIWYSGIKATADDLIKDFLKTAHADSVLLISDDRQLNEVAQDHGIVSVSPLFFVSRLREREGIKPVKNSVQGIVKTTDDSSEELDLIMHAYSSSIPHKKENGHDLSVTPKHKKSSKLERRLEALIRKL